MFLLMREANSERLNSVFCVSCFFYQKLCESGYHLIANWIKVVSMYTVEPLNNGHTQGPTFCPFKDLSSLGVSFIEVPR